MSEKCPKADLNCRDCDVRSLAGPEPDRQVFAKFKHLLRKAAARSAEITCVTIGEIIRAFTPNAPPISETQAIPNRGIEYSVVQGIGRHVWKWSVSLDTGVSVGGRTAIKSEAVTEAERAIDRALAPKKLRLVPPERDGTD